MGSPDSVDGSAPRIVALLRLAHAAGENQLVREVETELGPLGLRRAHLELMRYPGPDGARPNELARRVGSSKQVVHPLINELEGWGYLRREPDPEDGRGIVLRLTEPGWELVHAFRRGHARIEAEWEDRLGRTRNRALHEALQQIIADAEGGERAASPDARPVLRRR